MKDKPKIAIYKERFDKFPDEFDINWLKEQGTSPIKYIQVYIHDKPFLRVGGMYHKDLLQKTLNEFDLDFKFGPLPGHPSLKGPLIIGNKYKMVGTGKIKMISNQEDFKFYDYSAHYGIPENNLLSTNPDHLLKLGFKLIKTDKDKMNIPYFLMSFDTENKKEEGIEKSNISIKSNLLKESDESIFT